VQFSELRDLVAFIKSFQQKAIFFCSPWLSLFSLLGKALYFIDGEVERPDDCGLLVGAIGWENLACCRIGIPKTESGVSSKVIKNR